MTAKMDGNIQYTPASMFGEEQYVETVGNVQYRYTKDDSDNWTKTQVEESADDDSSNMFTSEVLEQLFNPDNYEKAAGEENAFKQKSDVEFEEFEDVTIRVEDTSCTIEMTASSNGMTFGVKLVLSKLGEVELTLPVVE